MWDNLKLENWIAINSSVPLVQEAVKITMQNNVLFSLHVKKVRNEQIFNFFDLNVLKLKSLNCFVFSQELPAIAAYKKSDKFKAHPINNKMANFK